LKIKITPTPNKAILFLVILILQSFIQKLSISESLSFLSVIDEIIVLFCIPFSIRMGLILFNKNIIFKGFFSFLVIYWVFAITSSLFGGGTFSQALYQFVLDSKYIVIFLYCYGAYRENVTEEYLAKFFKIFVLVNIPFVLLQLLMPSVYDAIFPLGAHHGSFFTATGEALTRAAGVFWFTGLLAFFAAIASGFFLIKIWKYGSNKVNFSYLIMSLFLLISTLSRGEISAFFIAITLTYLFFISNRKIRHINLVFMFALVTGITVMNASFIERGLVEIGFNETAAGLTLAPRANMMSAALSEANENFPLGSGLGTLGGQAAVIYDSDLFYKHGFQYTWYFEGGLFLTDTYWPKIIAESGWLGALFLLLAYVYYPLKYLQHSNSLCFSGVFSFFSMTVLLINSFSAPIYNSVIIVFIVMFICGFDNKNLTTITGEKSNV
jgi:hypothetical protein